VDSGTRDSGLSHRPSVDGLAMRALLGNFLTGVTIITTTSPDGPVGTTVNSFTSVSLDPPLVLFCLHSHSTMLAEISRSGTFAINILSEHQTELCRRFARRTTASFSGVTLRSGPDDPPVLADAIAYLDCEVTAQHPGGDHAIVVGRVIDLGLLRQLTPPLAFFRGSHPRVDLRWAEEVAYWPGG
jgi:3-hydroxy-9,10-secoandrosta-1,3,5(10)-triene-9,17-dione monooxygenase reductase component